jgi:hypothetical protein
MATMLITEALQQVKILTDRIQKKRDFIVKYVTFNSLFVDPLLRQGGSAQAIVSEFQSLTDLEKNLVDIRTAIQKKNLTTILTLEGRSQSIAEWLIWRREISGGVSTFYTKLAAVISASRTAHERDMKTASSSTVEGQRVKESNIVVNLNELQLAKDSEQFGVILGSLDAKLSIFNATTTIEL